LLFSFEEGVCYEKGVKRSSFFFKHNNQLVTLLCRSDIESTKCVGNNVVFKTLNIVYCGSVLIEKEASLNDMYFFFQVIILVIRMDDNMLSKENVG